MINQTAPSCDTSWFQRELDAMTRDRHISLRIAWAPSLNVLRVVSENGRPVPREYKKYPLIGKDELRPVTKGQFFYRNINGCTTTVGYQKAGGLVTGNVLPTDIAAPDIERVNPAIHLFVIENRREDEFARAVHAKKRELAIDNFGVDLFGDYPSGGVWDWYADVSEHRDRCCEMAAAASVRCRGLYREPDARDLEAIQQALQQRDERSTADEATQIEQAGREIRAGMLKYQENRRAERRQMAREIDQIATRAITKPAVYLDPAKRDLRLAE